MKKIAFLFIILIVAAESFAADQQWELVTNNYAGIQTDWWSVPAIEDLDADGDLDMLLGNGDRISHYRNDGNATAPNWTLVTDTYEGIVYDRDCTAPALTDIDKDGDYDLFVSGCSSKILFYRNDGTPSQPLWTFVTDYFIPHEMFPPLGCSFILTFTDMDNDGDQDFFLDSCDWIAVYYENIGTPAEAAFDFATVHDNWNSYRSSYVNNAVGLNGYGNYIAVEDIDSDGDLDMLASNTSGYLAFLRNIGDAAFPSWFLETTEFPGVSNPEQGYIFPVFVDIDGDGKKEIIMGDLDGYLSLYETVSTPETPAEAAAVVKEMLISGDLIDSNTAGAIIASLENAQNNLETSPVSATNMIGAAINKLEAQAGKKVDAATASQLIEMLNTIVEGI